MDDPKTPYDLFGVECDKGWRKIIEPLMERCLKEGVEIFQIKEKFGGLRFYVGACSEELRDAIAEAENLSEKTCEICGEPGALRSEGWMRTLCDEHAAELNYGPAKYKGVEYYLAMKPLRGDVVLLTAFGWKVPVKKSDATHIYMFDGVEPIKIGDPEPVIRIQEDAAQD